MLSAESFWTYSLRHLPEGGSITRILSAAISALEPGLAVTRQVAREGDILLVSGQRYDLRSFNRVVILGIGKASVAMSDAMALILADRLSAGLVISKHQSPNSNSLVINIIGGHPIPDEKSLEAGKKVLELLSSLSPKDLLICLISGGGSALVTAPIDGITLADIQSLNSTLLDCGARIDEINTIRRRLDLLKGGGWLRLPPAQR
jgi:glycerate 2-kinase